ncbi:MAG: endonuclease Q family protein [Patescibacteria group bacterium]|nr:endonuclease Q family protein [Patescibacteria group bacterium]
MSLIADLHFHSKYSRAVSKNMIIEEMSAWARIKGIDLLAIPDWTHSLWMREVKTQVVETNQGTFSLKEDKKGTKFLLSTEISSIYSQDGKTRRIHNLVLSPSFSISEKISKELLKRGANLSSDGRPIIGLSAIELADLVFSISKKAMIIPAHIWTPWFSLFGSRSGFDSLKECFGKFEDQIFAVETGLSSDPAMNWRVKELDRRAILSFSDAHSPSKIGREATCFDLKKEDLAYDNLTRAIKTNKIDYTIEFYPEEGKYHFTGHRKCNLVQSPEETKRLGAVCPVCGKALTVGVMHRVEELSSRPEGFKPKNRPAFKMTVPLAEILSEVLEVGPTSKKVNNEYFRLINELGPEFKILLEIDLKEIRKIAGEKLAEAIKKVRESSIVVNPGYDGVFGKVAIWGEKEASMPKQESLF